jgi:chromosome segregation ATPase
MSTPNGPDANAAPPNGAAHTRRNVWIWISAGLAVVAAGLLIWGLSAQSDNDDKDQEIAQLQSDLEQSQDRGGAVMSALKAGYDQLVAQLGAAGQDLDAATQGVEAAQQAGAEAAQKLEAARDQAAQAADDAAGRAQAAADQASAEAEAAQAKASVVANCLKASLSAFGSLFEGDNVRSQLSAIRGQIGQISADCKAALAGT